MQLEIEREALRKEKDKAPRATRELEKELADLKEQHTTLMARWQQEKEAIQRQRKLKEELEQLRMEIERVQRAGDYGKASELQYGRLPELERQMRAEDERLASAAKQGQAMLKEEVDEEDIAEVVSKWTHIPVSRLMEGEIQKLIHMEERLHQRVVGQDEAIRAVANAIRRARAGLQDPNRPLGSFIFLGPTGVGKTELARALAEFLFDDEHAMIRIDMSSIRRSTPYRVSLRDPRGLSATRKPDSSRKPCGGGPTLSCCSTRLRKASRGAERSPAALDDGRLTDGKGRTIDFKNTVVIMTSNLGSAFLADLSDSGVDEGVRRQVLDALRRTSVPNSSTVSTKSSWSIRSAASR